MSLPADDNILLSIVNTALRDGETLADFCARYSVEEGEVFLRLKSAGYAFDEEGKRFKITS